MSKIFRARLSLLVLFCATLPACDVLDRAPEWDDLGELPAAASTRLNHTPMIVIEDGIIVGTNDGLWQRSLDRSDDWEQIGLEAGLDGVRIFAVRRHPTDAATLFAAGEPLDDPEAAPFYRSDDGGVTWIPSTAWPLNPVDDTTEIFYDLAIAPDEPDRLYANLSGASIAISTDGGMNWTLANGETAALSGDPCVLHILESQPDTLYQGCETALDDAWIGTYDIDPDDPLELDNFTFVAGGPDFALGNRRPNSLASSSARPDTLYAGLEGALITVEGNAFDWLLQVDEGGDDLPYAHIKGIWLDPNDGDHLIFGGGVTGENTELALFETNEHGDNIEQLDAPRSLHDPVVEQIVPIDDDDLAVLISTGDGAIEGDRALHLFVLDPNGDPFN